MPDLSTSIDAPPPAAPPPDGAPALVDAFPDSRPFRLDGWLERNGFHPIWTAILVLLIGFGVFNIVGAIVIGVGMVADIAGNGGEAPSMDDLQSMLTGRGTLVLTSNTVGQIVGFALVALLAARLSTRDVKPFLRLKMPEVPGLGLAALGWAALYPIVLFAGELNARLPLPESLKAIEEAQTEMIQQLLTGGDISTAFLFVAVAVTPAVAEELIFRGYLHRQVERTFGAVTAIVAIGVVFGLYHLRLTQALPLSILGVYLGFVVWATGSVWTGAVVHLLNNGLAVLATAYATANPDVIDLDDVEAASVPLPVVLLCAVAFAGVCRWILARRRAVAPGEDARPPAAAPPPLSPLSTPLPA